MTIEVIEISHMFQGRIQQPCSTVVARIFRRRRSFSSSSRCYSRRFSGDRDVLITLWACSSNGANSLHSRGEWNARKFRRIRSNCLSRPICRALQGTDALSHSKSIFTPKADKQQPAESIPTRDTKKEDSKKSAKTFSTVYADYYKTEREREKERERERNVCAETTVLHEMSSKDPIVRQRTFLPLSFRFFFNTSNCINGNAKFPRDRQRSFPLYREHSSILFTELKVRPSRLPYRTWISTNIFAYGGSSGSLWTLHDTKRGFSIAFYSVDLLVRM